MTRLLLALFAVFVVSCKPAAPPPPPPPPPIPLDLSGALVIGASVSDGFGALLPGQRPTGLLPIGVRLATTLGVLAEGGTPPTSIASSMFFMNPELNATRQLAAAKEPGVPIVFALDYLFWHAYGAMPEPVRPQLFEIGLERVASLGKPVVVCDLPDMSHAIGAMLSAAQVPQPETLAALNARLDEWAAQHPKVVVLRLRDMVAQGMAGGTTRLGGRTFTGPSARALLTGDGLHATIDGQIVLCLEMLDALRAAGLLPSNAVWETDPALVQRALQERSAKGPS
mgnify:CR=1 FL=1